MPFGFVIALNELERIAVEGLDLVLDEHRDPLHGTWKGSACVLRESRWQGPRIAVFRTVCLTGRDLEIVNVLGVARAPLDAPILGIDLVAARPDAGVVVADISPLDPPQTVNAALPEWAQGIFSSAPLIARVEPASAGGALDRVARLVEAFCGRVRDAAPVRDDAARQAALERYRAGHLADARMQAMLAHMFGADQAASLMRERLFPRIEEVDVHA